MEKEIINYTIPNLKFAINRHLSHSSPWRKEHIHDEVEIVYILRGITRINMNKEKITARGGDVILINSNVVHSIEDIASSEISYIQIDLQDYYENSDMLLYRFISVQNARPYCFFEGQSELGNIFLAIYNEINEKKSFCELYVKAYIQLLIPFMLRNGIITELSSKALKKAERILPVAKYIDANYMEKISLDALSSLIGYSKYELCRKFKAATGKTVVEYINYVRLYHAKIHLKKSEKSITEIALNCGFSTVQYFNRTFKKINGCSPKEFAKHAIDFN